MKTTLNISEPVMKLLKEEAARQHRTMSELVETALRLFLEKSQAPRADLPPLPRFDGGRALVDVSNREALYRAMEAR